MMPGHFGPRTSNLIHAAAKVLQSVHIELVNLRLRLRLTQTPEPISLE